MSDYTKSLTARQIIEYIANDYKELSHEKVLWQRDDFMKICQEWLDHNPEMDPITAEWMKVNERRTKTL